MKMNAETLKGFGQFLQAAASITVRGVNAVPQIKAVALGLTETTPDQGGFLVPHQFAQALMEQIANETQIAKLCTTIPVETGNRVKFPALDERSRSNGSRWGGVTSAWIDEASTITASKAKFRSVELILGKLTAALYATEEILSSPALLGKFIEMVLPLEAAFQLDSAILKGSGLGQPLGVLNSNALITVAKDVSQTAATITASNITNMFARVLPEARRRGVWLVSGSVEAALYNLPAPSGAASLIFSPPDQSATAGRLCGVPIVPCEQCSNIGVVGDILFFDGPNYLVAEKIPDLRLSVDVAFLSGEGVFRMIYRCAGEPGIQTAITPFDGSATRSSFVTLAAR